MNNDKFGFSERITELVDSLEGGNNSKFSRTLGCGESVIRSYKNGVMPKADIIAKIADIYDVSPEWLLLGSGEMFLRKTKNTQKVKGDNNFVAGSSIQTGSREKSEVDLVEAQRQIIERLSTELKEKDLLISKKDQRIEELTNVIIKSIK